MDLPFDALRFHQLNRERAMEQFFKDNLPTNEELFTKLVEEVGEVGGAISKIRRQFTPHLQPEDFSSDVDYRDAQEEWLQRQKENFKAELGQVYIMLSQLATFNGISLEAAAVAEFNKLSKKLKSQYYY